MKVRKLSTTRARIAGNTLLPGAGGKYSAAHNLHVSSLDLRARKGRASVIPHDEKDGYGSRLCKADVGLGEVKTAVGVGGFVWVNVDDRCEPLADFVGRAFEDLEAETSYPMEVFHYHQAVVDTNYKLWHDTNRELYHDYMHYHNRLTGLTQKGYFDRVFHTYPNGHVQLDSMEIQYQAYKGKQRSLPGPVRPRPATS